MSADSRNTAHTQCGKARDITMWRTPASTCCTCSDTELAERAFDG